MQVLSRDTVAMPPRTPTTPAAMRLRRAVAARVRELAEKRGVSLVKLADFAGLSNAHLGRLLAAEQSATLDTLAKLADALDVSVRDLFPPTE